MWSYIVVSKSKHFDVADLAVSNLANELFRIVQVEQMPLVNNVFASTLKKASAVIFLIQSWGCNDKNWNPLLALVNHHQYHNVNKISCAITNFFQLIDHLK